jgi:putative alpha-1,2-mannosidase
MTSGHREAERSSAPRETLFSLVDPFVGTEPTDLPSLTGPAAAWFWPKPQIGNTHPGACLPLGLVSVMPFTGGYPTGYGRYGKSLQGRPVAMFDQLEVSGFTHFQQSGVGAIRKYYNYCRVTPLLAEAGGLPSLGTCWQVDDELASPGFYSCRLPTLGVLAELTVTPRGAVHRYTFPASAAALLAIDFSHGGIAIEDGRTLPLRSELRLLDGHSAEACVTMEGLPIRMAVAVSGLGAAGGSASLWEAGELLDGRERAYDSIRDSTYRPFGVVFTGPTVAGQQVELEVAFSLRSRERARRHLASAPKPFTAARRAAGEAWQNLLGRIEVDGGTASQRRTFATALYHSLIKPSEAQDESPFWPWDGPFYFDFATLWDMYKTQLPLLLTLCPDAGADIVNSLLTVFEMEGNFPIGYRLARGYDRFAHQASGLVHVLIADAFHHRLPGIDWERAVALMVKDFARAYGEAFLQDGLVHPITHTLDLAYAGFCTATVARGIGDTATAARMDDLAGRWRNAFAADGLLKDSTFYEGTKWNYSFRLLQDMAGRIALAGGDAAFVKLLDRFFGIGAAPVRQPGEAPTKAEMAAGAALGRFEGFNNEPDMEAPYAYVYAGRHDRTCEIVRAGLDQCFGDTPGGMVGNDDSGGMSSWYVWNALGLFPVAGQDLLLIGSPLFASARLQLAGNVEFTIAADGNAEDRPYVASAALNGRQLAGPFLRWAELAGGGTLELQMSSQPHSWSTERPPSASAAGVS